MHGVRRRPRIIRARRLRAAIPGRSPESPVDAAGVADAADAVTGSPSRCLS